MKTKTEQALARIFAHCDAVASGEKPTTSVEESKKMAAAFLGNLNVQTEATAGASPESTTEVKKS